MNENILTLEPRLLWKNFRELTLIPHPSKHEEQITKYLLEFGRQHADETFIDNTGNVIWRKAATPGMETRKGIILQAHCDMVPQAESGKNHNFITDPIVTVVKDGFVSADGTTLGGDDGIGVAAIMAIFENDSLAHGPLEGLITIDEETGLTGAVGLEPGLLRGSTLINLDSEEHGIFYIGCAGGVNVNISLPVNMEPLDSEGITIHHITLRVSGFMGGHSGADIHKNRPNAAKILFRLINRMQEAGLYFGVGNTESGNMHNAIPREASAEIYISGISYPEFSRILEDYQITISKEYGGSDPDGKIEALAANRHTEYMDAESLRKVNYIVNTLQSGVFAMSADMPGLVETSNNLSVLRVENGMMRIQCLLRSSVQSQSDYLKEIIKMQMDFCGAKVEFEGEYPGWKPNPKSDILEKAKKVYKAEFGGEPLVTAIHAGLECGMIIDKYPGMDAISLGPNVFGVHTPSEKVEISSCVDFMRLLEGIIKN